MKHLLTSCFTCLIVQPVIVWVCLIPCCCCYFLAAVVAVGGGGSSSGVGGALVPPPFSKYVAEPGNCTALEKASIPAQFFSVTGHNTRGSN